MTSEHDTPDTGESARSGLLASAVGLERMRLVMNLVGTLLAWGIGGALFSLAILRMSVLPSWLGWLGLVFALLVWLTVLQLVYGPFEQLLLPTLLVGLVWLSALGVALLLIDPSSLPRGATPLITDVGFVKLGGAIELVAMGLFVASFAVSIASGLPEPNPDPGAMGTWLSEVRAADAAYRATSWLFVVNHLLEIVFVVALYRLFLEAGGVILFALLAGVLGLLLVAVSGILQFGLAELAALYAGAGAPDR